MSKQGSKNRTIYEDIFNLPTDIEDFTPEDPERWFDLLENKFVRNGVTHDTVKLMHTVKYLVHTEYANEVKQVIVPKLKEQNGYETLKNLVLEKSRKTPKEKMMVLIRKKLRESIDPILPDDLFKLITSIEEIEVDKQTAIDLWWDNLPKEVRHILGYMRRTEDEFIITLKAANELYKKFLRKEETAAIAAQTSAKAIKAQEAAKEATAAVKKAQEAAAEADAALKEAIEAAVKEAIEATVNAAAAKAAEAHAATKEVRKAAEAAETVAERDYFRAKGLSPLKRRRT